MTKKEVVKMLGVGGKSLKKYKGVFQLYESNYYWHGMNAIKLKDHVLKNIPYAEIVDFGDDHEGFVGTGGFWVKFKVIV